MRGIGAEVGASLDDRPTSWAGRLFCVAAVLLIVWSVAPEGPGCPPTGRPPHAAGPPSALAQPSIPSDRA